MQPRAVALVALASISACADQQTPSPTGPGLAINVAPLQLADVTNVCYALEAKTAGGVVWRKDHLCADQYGNAAGGDLAYVGPCDADVPAHTVTLAIENFYSTAVPFTSPTVAGDPTFENPCVDNPITPGLEGCTRSATCIEDGDVPVTFDLTVMRQANQGFFDVAVNFSDIFCSAKVDCQPSLLHNPSTSQRGPTAVLAFACTAGSSNVDTTLYMDDIVVDCDGNTNDATLAPLTPGNNGAKGASTYQTAVYYGDEQLAGYDKCYWNASFGLTGTGSNCHIKTRATASQGDFVNPFTTPAGTAYPIVDIDVALSGTSCAANPLNGNNSGVTTEYTTTVATGESFDNMMPCGVAPSSFSCVACPDGSVCNEAGTGCSACASSLTEDFENGFGTAWKPSGKTGLSGPSPVQLIDGATNNYVMLTPLTFPQNGQVGALYNDVNQVGGGTTSISFDVFVSDDGVFPPAGDGVALTVVQTTAAALPGLVAGAGGGGWIGYGSASPPPVSAVTVEIDSVYNSPTAEAYVGGGSVPVGPHIAVTRNLHSDEHLASVAYNESTFYNAWHTVKVELVGQRLRVYLDAAAAPVLDVNTSFTFAGGYVWLSAATGSFASEHRVDNVRIDYGCGN